MPVMKQMLGDPPNEGHPPANAASLEATRGSSQLRVAGRKPFPSTPQRLTFTLDFPPVEVLVSGLEGRWGNDQETVQAGANRRDSAIRGTKQKSPRTLQETGG